MNTKSHLKIVHSGDYLEQACIKGLTEVQRKKALEVIEQWKNRGSEHIPYALIRKEILNKSTDEKNQD